MTVNDDERGRVKGRVVSFNHEGYPMVSFDGLPPVVVFRDLVDFAVRQQVDATRAMLRENGYVEQPDGSWLPPAEDPD